MIKVVKEGLQYITGMTPNQEEKIIQDLTLDNPAYQQAKAFSRYRVTNIPPYLMFYNRLGDGLIVPRGYEIPFEHKVVKDLRVTKKSLYPPFKLELRKDQQEAYEAWTANPDRGMLVLPTGKGKSILGCYLAYATRQRTLVVVQKNDLIDGWMSDFSLCFGLEKGRKVGLIKGKNFHIGSQITLATIQTLAKMDPEQLAKLHEKFGMVILDECHHSVAKSYEIFKSFKAKYFVGLTATDELKSGLRQVQYWLIGNVGYRCANKLNDEDIMPYTVICRKSVLAYDPPEEFTYRGKIISAEEASELRRNKPKEKWLIKRKPLNPQVLKELLRDETFNNLVARDIIKEYKAGKSCIAFLHEKEHIRLLRDLLINLGTPRDQIQLYYGDSKTPDAVMKEKAESKEVLITIATFSKATEGTNVKAWERAFLVTSINDVKNTKQAVGRIRRRKAGKPDAIVYDYYHPGVKGMRSHIKTRMKAYKETKAQIVGYKKEQTPIITRGFRR